MAAITITEGATWAIVVVATVGVIARPWRLPEAVWAVLGAASLVALALVSWREALSAVGRGADVYLFLAGMMLLAELARQHGVFDWVAALAAEQARGSADRLFALVFCVGTLVTVFLSNDATAVVLTPAVYAAAKAVKAEPLPYLFICAFVANAASFVLPISNPANLVVFGGHMPPLPSWLAQFALPSLLSIGATYTALRLTQRESLRQPIAKQIDVPALSRAGGLTAYGIGGAAALLLSASAFDIPLGGTTFLAGALTACVVLLDQHQAPWDLIKGISWSVLPLVAGLFVMVEGLVRTGVIQQLSQALQTAPQNSTAATSWAAGAIVAVACNLMNNLPVGLIAGSVVAAASAPPQITGALLIGVDLGPNLCVTGSLATILWLVALRRDGLHVSTWRLIRLGAVVTTPALLLALTGSVMVHL
ncbi:arsenite efflux membrane protein ArsB [Rhizobiales bacterium GAS191]|nr:arsenite efflux membrane protein ArsB [Rhizobiales bacterium GAS191]